MTATKWQYLGPGRWVVDVPGSNACPVCSGSGYRSVELPIFADGNYSDAERLEERCRCNPAPTDADAPDWRDDRPAYPAETPYPDFECPVIDYDPAVRERIDGTLPARLLA